MATRAFIYVVISAIGLTSGCGNSSAPPTPATGSATTVAQAAVTPAPTIPPLAPVSEEKAGDFGQRMIDAIAQGRTQANGLEDYIDWSAMLDRAYQGLNVPAASKAAFLRGFMTSAKGKNGLSVQIQANIQNGGSYVITRVLDRPEGTRLRLRLLQPAGGVNFHDFLLRESPDGLRAVDLRIAATGEDMSETFRRLEVLSQAQQSRSFLDRLSGKDVAFVKHWSQIERMIQSNQQSKFDETLKIASTLPLEVRNEKFCLLQELVAAIQGGGPDALVEVIDRYRSAHPNDPALEIFSIDYYAAKRDLKQAIESAQKLNNSLEGDGHMLWLIADLQQQTGLLKEARQTIEQSIQLEPNLKYNHWTKVIITVAQEDHAATRDTLKELMETFQVSLDLSAFESEKVFTAFLASPECAELKALIKSRSTAP